MGGLSVGFFFNATFGFTTPTRGSIILSHLRLGHISRNIINGLLILEFYLKWEDCGTSLAYIYGIFWTLLLEVIIFMIALDMV